jgi:hypothetical protein
MKLFTLMETGDVMLEVKPLKMVKKLSNGSTVRIAYNVLRLGGRFNAAKPLLYEVPTYLVQNSIGTLNRKTKRKKKRGK